MLDTHGREVRTLRLAVTEACDLRCVYCMPDKAVPPRGEPLTADELTAVAQAAVNGGITKIRLTGGEPLSRPDIIEICERIGRISGLQSLCLTTNGTRLARLAAALKNAGVSRVNISLDTMKPERYRRLTRGGELQNVLNGIDTALGAGFEKVKINCVLIGGVNDDEIPAFVSLTKSKLLEVRFIELMPMGECANWPQERFISADRVLAACPELRKVTDEGVAERYALPGAIGRVGLIRPMSHAFCGTCDRIRVTADGMLKPCLHSGEEINLRGLQGHALEEKLAQGINDKPATHRLNDAGTQTDRRMNQIGG